MLKETQLIKEILQVLYCELDENGEVVLNKDKEWDGDTLPTIAEMIYNHGFMQFHGMTLKPENFITIKWGIDDVMGHAEEMEMEVSEDEARSILLSAERNHDCTIGITWDTFDYLISETVRDRETPLFCQACTTGDMKGVIEGVLSNGERCDTCEKFASDEEAGKAIAESMKPLPPLTIDEIDPTFPDGYVLDALPDGEPNADDCIHCGSRNTDLLQGDEHECHDCGKTYIA
jgi:hypothetical protein